MTPGQRALADAAAMETARVYGRTLREQRAAVVPSVGESLDAGATNGDLCRLYGWDEQTAQEARKSWLRRVS